MRGLANLIRAEFMRTWLELVRYPLQFALGLLLVGVIFYLLLGFANLAGVATANQTQLTRLLVGYLLGLVALGIISAPAMQVSKEAKSGTLENMVLSGQGLTAFFVVQTLTRFWLNLVQFGVLFVVLAHIAQISYTLSWQAIPAFVLYLIAALGLGLVLSALMLLFKDVNNIFVLVQLMVFPAVIVELPQLEWFPLVLGASVIREILLGGTVEAFRWALLMLGTVAIYSLGVFIFQSADVAARKRGLLGHE